MKKINDNAPVKCRKSIFIGANPEKVWAAMSNIDQWASWQTDIKSPRLRGGLKPDSTFTWKSGGAKINSTLHAVDPGNVLGWTGKTFGIFAIHNWSFKNENGRTQVVVEESMEGLLAKLFKSAFQKNLDKSLQNWLELLKTKCEG